MDGWRNMSTARLAIVGMMACVGSSLVGCSGDESPSGEPAPSGQLAASGQTMFGAPGLNPMASPSPATMGNGLSPAPMASGVAPSPPVPVDTMPTTPVSPMGTGGGMAPPFSGSGGFPGSGPMPPMPGPMPPMAEGPSAPAPAGAGPSTPAVGTGDISSCTPPPDGSSESTIRAWTLMNEMRLAAGSTCMNIVPELTESAQKHCDYRAANRGNASCGRSAHDQVAGCPGFTGADVQSREVAAGYPRQLAYTEVALTYGDNPEQAIPGWLVTPFHRIPMIDPWTTDMGWGGGPGCDVIDFGRGQSPPPAGTVVVYPYDGQTEVPLRFNGLEAPQPPEPAGGWPSSYPISIYADRLQVADHVLTKDGDATPLDHVWLDKSAPVVSLGLRAYFSNTAVLYGAPFEANTTYRVKITGTHAGGNLDVEWTFTTGQASRNPFGF